MNTREKIARMNASFGPAAVVKPVTCNGITEDYTFRRLPFITADEIRSHALGNDGNFDQTKFVGHNARLVQATLLDDDGSQFSLDEVSMWDPVLVDAIASVCNTVNAIIPKAEVAAAKNSDATPGDTNS